ncbi:MAG: transporter [Lachnospiraceae bacterium]|nr:transporter [Lachnospiraceae bacterium]
MNNKLFVILLLNVLLMLYSFGGFFSKKAASYSFMSVEFILCYLGLIFILGIYAICWQQILKKLPLTLAYANKAITILWGIVWGKLFFGETVSFGKIAGAGIVVIGIVLFALSDSEKESDKQNK